jgi:hypothetical protein
MTWAKFAFSALVPTIPLTDCDILAAGGYGVPEEGIAPPSRTFPGIDETSSQQSAP